MMVLTENIQPIEKVDHKSPHLLQVHSVFDTIQGEGIFAGTPATFIRMAGCNLRCRWCDTDYTQGRQSISLELLMKKVEELPRRNLVVITGGEPFRQDISLLVAALQIGGRKVQIETNGLLYGDFMKSPAMSNITIVCSPKTQRIDDRMWKRIVALKYVVEAGQIDEDGLPLLSVGPQYGRPARPPEYWKGVIFVQPLDVQDPVKNLENLKAAAESCMKHNYILTTQIHKEVGLP